MNNIFNYATKELSQDAYLMWLISSYNDQDENLASFSRKFIFYLLGVEQKPIDSIKIYPQLSEIDTACHIQIADKHYILAIEDKTTSEEHNQLEKYSEDLEDIRKNYFKETGIVLEIKKIFYKTGVIDSNEEERLKNNRDWSKIGIREIKKFYDENSCDNIFVNQYKETINSIYPLYTEQEYDCEMNEINYAKLLNHLKLFKENGFIINITNTKCKVCFQILKEYHKDDLKFYYGPTIHIEPSYDNGLNSRWNIWIYFNTTVGKKDNWYQGKSNPNLRRYNDVIIGYARQLLNEYMEGTIDNKMTYYSTKKEELTRLSKVHEYIQKLMEKMNENQLNL